VLPALMRAFDDARHSRAPDVILWGTGRPRREFLHADDLADACLFLMNSYDGAGHINVGSGEDISIAELAELVRAVVYPAARIQFDAAKPDGAPLKRLDVTRLHALGWRHRRALAAGIADTYRWYATRRAGE
jgi:GDP-L-fucose synthase